MSLYFAILYDWISLMFNWRYGHRQVSLQEPNKRGGARRRARRFPGAHRKTVKLPSWSYIFPSTCFVLGGCYRGERIAASSWHWGGPTSGGAPAWKIKVAACQNRVAANLRTKTLDFRGFDSSRILVLRGRILMSIGNLSDILRRQILAGIILVILAGRSGVWPRAKTGFHNFSHMGVGDTP